MRRIRYIAVLFFINIGFYPIQGFTFTPGPAELLLLKKIKHILTEVTTFQANFLQETPNDCQEGMLYIKRPGRMRLEYTPPSPLLLIAHNDWLTQYNKNTGQTEQILVADTPAAFLLNAHKDFKKNFAIKKWHQTPGLLIVEVGSDILENLDMKLTVIFETQPFALKQWITEDATGYQTKVTLFNWLINPPLADSLFLN